jgi:hypothetical protein
MSYFNIGTAKTLIELRDAVNTAIELCGEDAEWNGFDDGSIYIHPKDVDNWAKIDDGSHG